MPGCCEHSNDKSNFIKGEEFDRLSNFSFKGRTLFYVHRKYINKIYLPFTSYSKLCILLMKELADCSTAFVHFWGEMKSLCVPGKDQIMGYSFDTCLRTCLSHKALDLLGKL
jgi:hypothetical protein